MSIEDNLQIVRRRFEAWQRGELFGPEDSTHPDIELVTDPAWPEPGTYRGRDEVRRFYERYAESWGDIRSLDFELIPAGDKVVARWRNPVAGRHSGIAIDNNATTVFTIRDGQVVRIEYFFDHDEALRAAGLQAS
jgi:ketosteroid isomerase-like protein